MESKVSSGKAFPPRLWLGPKARTLEYGYTMFAHKESPAKDFEAWIPEKEHSALLQEKDKELKAALDLVNEYKEDAEYRRIGRDSLSAQLKEKDKEIERLRAALKNVVQNNDWQNTEWAKEALAGGKDG